MTLINRFLLGAVAAAALAGSAQATTVDFNELTSEQGISVGPIYSVDGLTFDSNATSLESLGSLGSDVNADPTGATLNINIFDGILTVTKTGGGTFFLRAFDLADGFNEGAPSAVPFSWVDGGGSHSSTLVLDTLPGLETFVLNLTGITSFSLVQAFPFWQIDNVVYNEGCAIRGGCGGGGGPVPEPATWALMIAGFGLAGVALRRRRVQMA